MAYSFVILLKGNIFAQEFREMIDREIEILIYKYLDKTADDNDLRDLGVWAAANEEEFAEYIRLNTLIKGSVASEDIKKARQALITKVTTNKWSKNRIAPIYKYAALFIGILGLLFFYRLGFWENKTSKKEIGTSEENITLELDNGDSEVIYDEAEKRITDDKGVVIGVQKGNRLFYTGRVTDGNLVYHELKVPYGKKFELVLSDSTRVHLNAGSSLRYPIQFIENGKRQVFLTGEAYFSVTEDKELPFSVNAEEIDIEVLGTAFNISVYPEDAEVRTVLVEGAVKVSRSNLEQSSALLDPGHMAAYNRENGALDITKVDTSLYTAWKDGILLFRNTPFSSIKRKLERHFNISIVNRYEFLDNQIYTASFFKEEDVKQILEVFRQDTPFEYRMEDKTIIINRPIH